MEYRFATSMFNVYLLAIFKLFTNDDGFKKIKSCEIFNSVAREFFFTSIQRHVMKFARKLQTVQPRRALLCV